MTPDTIPKMVKIHHEKRFISLFFIAIKRFHGKKIAIKGQNMKNIALLLPLAIALAAHANPYAAGSQQWHDYNALGAQMTQDMNQRMAAQAAAAQQAAAQQAENVPQHLRPQWHPADNFGFIYVGFNPNAFADNNSSPGTVGYDSLSAPDVAARSAQGKCFDSGAQSPDSCQLLFSYRNMCGAVASGTLRSGRGERFYPSVAVVHTEEEADAAALAHCRADSAVNPDSCRIRGSVGENCANATKTMR